MAMISPRVVCFGELLLRLGAPGNQLLLQSPTLDVHAGGAEANVGVSLAHFGHDVAMISVLADNPLGAAVAGPRLAPENARAVATTSPLRTAARFGLACMRGMPFGVGTGDGGDARRPLSPI